MYISHFHLDLIRRRVALSSPSTDMIHKVTSEPSIPAPTRDRQKLLAGRKAVKLELDDPRKTQKKPNPLPVVTDQKQIVDMWQRHELLDLVIFVS